MTGAVAPLVLHHGIATNTLHVSFPPGKGLQAVSALLGRFGDVASIKILPDEEKFATAVVYFDIRAAALAHKALTALGHCSRKAPQTGSRNVRVSGEVQVEQHEHEVISNVREAEGMYILEFYDVRDATRFEARVAQTFAAREERCTRNKPEMLDLPPGLESYALQRKTIKEAAADPAMKTTYSVVIEDLPTGILSDLMMKAVLQQAGLADAVVSFSTHVDKPDKKRSNKAAGKPAALGSATINFSSRHTAERCVHHFHGCQWDRDSGAIVTARLETSASAEPQKAAPKSLSAKAVAFLPTSCIGATGFDSSHLNAAAPAFDPSGFDSSQASRKVPAFNPRQTSDASTEAGESSEIEDDAIGLGVFAGLGAKPWLWHSRPAGVVKRGAGRNAQT